jgi:hypothetical protein
MGCKDLKWKLKKVGEERGCRELTRTNKNYRRLAEIREGEGTLQDATSN